MAHSLAFDPARRPTVVPMACAHGPATVLDLWAAGLLPATHVSYRKHLTRFARFLGLTLDELPDTLLAPSRAAAYAALRRYRGHLLAQGRAPSTVNGALAAVRSLVAVAREAEMIDWALDIKSVRVVGYRDTRGCTRDMVAALLAQAAAQVSPWRAARDVLAVRLLHDLALRCHEVTSLTDRDIESDPSGPVALWVLGKGHQQRVRIALPAGTRDALRHWHAARPATAGPAPAAAGDRSLLGLGDRGLALLLARLGRAAGVGHVHPHALRHLAIGTALEAGHSPLRVRAFSRHARLETLLVYYARRDDGADQVATSVAAALPPT